MSKLRPILLFASAIAGCASGNWYKDNATEQDFHVDRGFCNAQAASVSLPRIGQQDAVFRGCMEGRGWVFRAT